MHRTRDLLLGIGISAVAATWLVATTDLHEVVERLGHVQLVWLFPALAVLAVQALIRATRWAALVRSATGRQIATARVVDPMLFGYFVNAVAPGRFGELARTLAVSRRESVAFSAVAASVVVERAVDVTALAALASLALALSGSDWWIPFAGLALVVSTVLALGSRAPLLARLVPGRTPVRIADGIRGFLAAVAAIRGPVLVRAAGLSAAAWLGDAMLVLLVGQALGLNIAPAGAVAIGLGGSLGTALPAAPGYLATYELGAVTLGAFASVARETVLPVAVLTHLVGVLVLAAAGAVALGRLSGVVRLGAVLQGNRLTIAREES